MSSTKVSIVVTAHNYAEYLGTCLDSAVEQTYDDYEVIVVDDGSTDITPDILREYAFEYPDLITRIRLEGEGLPVAANAGIENANGEYVIRLDADDYFDENILLVLATYLDSNPEIDLVYPDYYTCDDEGNIIDHVRLPTVGEEVKLLNRSPLAAGAMYRKDAWETLGGYDKKLSYQEDFDFWIRFTNRFEVRNLNLPLLYYRQHDDSMSTNLDGRLNARRSVKREFVTGNLDTEDHEVLAVIPARAERRIDVPDYVSDPIGDQPLALYETGRRSLIEFSIVAALGAPSVDRVIVSTENEAIAEKAAEAGAEVPFLRPEHLSESQAELADVVADLLSWFESEEAYVPDVVTILPYISPLRTWEHVQEAIDTHLIFSVDSVISVEQNRKFLWEPGEFGLEPLFEERLLREEKEGLLQENGATYVIEPSVVRNRDEIIGDRVGHVIMQRRASVHIDDWTDLVLLDGILERLEGTGVIGLESLDD